MDGRYTLCSIHSPEKELVGSSPSSFRRAEGTAIALVVLGLESLPRPDKQQRRRQSTVQTSRQFLQTRQLSSSKTEHLRYELDRAKLDIQHQTNLMAQLKDQIVIYD